MPPRSSNGREIVALQIETLLTPIQAASILQVKPNTLAKWRVTGEGPAFIRIGRAVRYSAREIARFIESHTRRSTSEK
jgi:predicted DNA-binding transcriptional regulator AlpA